MTTSSSPWVTIHKSKRLMVRLKKTITKTPFLEKWIILQLMGRVKAVSIYLVRDGHFVKHVSGPRVQLHFLGLKESIRSKNIGALWKKYKVPKSTRAIIKNRSLLHQGCMTFALLMKRFKSVERVNGILEKSRKFTVMRQRLNMLKTFEGFLSPERQVQYICYNFLRDIYRCYTNILTAGTETSKACLDEIDWTDSPEKIHDYLTLNWERIQNSQVAQAIPYLPTTKEDVEKADKTLEKLTLRLANSGEDLIRWGNHLNHCIGSYTKEAFQYATKEKYIMLGVFEENQELPTWTIEMQRNKYATSETDVPDRKWHICQFYGNYNSRPPEDVRKLVISAINQKG